MQSKIFTFNRMTKNPREMEDKINGYLMAENLYRLATLIGGEKIILSLLTVPCQDVSKLVKCKVVRTNDPKKLESIINDFMDGIILKGKVMCLSGSSTIYTILFYVDEPEVVKAGENGTNQVKKRSPGPAQTAGQDQPSGAQSAVNGENSTGTRQSTGN